MTQATQSCWMCCFASVIDAGCGNAAAAGAFLVAACFAYCWVMEERIAQRYRQCAREQAVLINAAMAYIRENDHLGEEWKERA